jgi:hypothetical protein
MKSSQYGGKLLEAQLKVWFGVIHSKMNDKQYIKENCATIKKLEGKGVKRTQ